MTETLALSWTAYTSEHFDPIYLAHAERVGHRLNIRITHGGEYAKVTTTPAELDNVRAFITDVEKANA